MDSEASVPVKPVKVINVIDPCVVHVHSAEVAPSGVIPRTEGFSPSERAPSVSAAEAEAETNSPAGTAVP